MTNTPVDELRKTLEANNPGFDSFDSFLMDCLLIARGTDRKDMQKLLPVFKDLKAGIARESHKGTDPTIYQRICDEGVTVAPEGASILKNLPPTQGSKGTGEGETLDGLIMLLQKHALAVCDVRNSDGRATKKQMRAMRDTRQEAIDWHLQDREQYASLKVREVLEELRSGIIDRDLVSAYDYDYKMAGSTVKSHNKIIKACNDVKADVRDDIDQLLATKEKL